MQAHKKVCDENKTKKEEKNHGCIPLRNNYFDGRK